ncbi:condensation domain-containing protein [Clostridium sp.]|uniref:condensation domain-containing protein n=1 Tax=Clostridium sp. TaxID=1506 RepID=UPI00289D6893|nr:condensation domain-containing protein [Clostridium sp.]
MTINLSNLKLDELNNTDEINVKKTSKNDIAIIGIAGQLPMADTMEEFWHNLKTGTDCVRSIPQDRLKYINAYLEFVNIDKGSIKVQEQAYLDDIDKFDYRFFNLSPNEAALMDPNQRIFLKTAWHVLEDAGYAGERIKGSKTGVYVGFSSSIKDNYQRIMHEVRPDLSYNSITANMTSILPSRISYMLDLKGPTMVVDTACSSSLVAVHLACQGIRMGNCDMAIAGGVKISLLPLRKVGEKSSIESSDYRTRSFDDSASGTGGGEGSVAILLKPLARALKDKDNIYAVIKGSAINQDGRSISIAAPNSLAQADVIVEAWRDAGINPEHVSYIEAHGTATNLGDPVEIEGINMAFKRYTGKKQFCAIGSVKSNIGHLDTTAGLAGIVKTVMALKHKKLPPTLHFTRPNRNIKFHNSPVYINESFQDWESEDYPRLCGVSSFGLSGTNCHVVLEEAPATLSVERKIGVQALTISAKSEFALVDLLELYASYFEVNKDVNLQDVCYTANTGREHYSHRVVIIAESSEEMKIKLSQLRSTVLQEYLEDGVFYGVIGAKGNVTEGEKCVEDIDPLGHEIQEKVDKLIEEIEKNKDVLYEICHLYVKGATIKWDKIYHGKNCWKLPLPLYPFQKERCWIEIPEGKKTIGRNICPNMLENKNEEKQCILPVKLKGREDEAYTVIEKKVAQIWSDVLGFKIIDIDDNYYELGGDSLTGIKIMNRINMQLELNIAAVELHKHLTVREFSRYLEKKSLIPDSYVPLVKKQNKDYYELSSAQKRLFMLDRFESGDSYHNIEAFIIRGKVEKAHLEKTLKAIKGLIQRHEALRTSFQFVDGEPVQVVHRDIDFDFEYEEANENNIEAIIKTFQRPFEFSRAPLLRAKLVKFSEERHMVIIDLHQIICDRASIRIFIQEFEALYNSKMLPKLNIQYKDFSEWQNKLLKTEYLNRQMEYWKNVFNGPIPVLNMPMDYTRPSQQSFEGDYYTAETDRELHEELKRLARRTGSTLYMVLLSAYYILLNKYTGKEDIIIGFPSAGRQHEDLENNIGMFANTLAVRNYPGKEKTFLKFLSEVKENALNAYANQDCQFEDLIGLLDIQRDMSRNPLFDVMFIMHVHGTHDIYVDGLEFLTYEYKSNVSKFDLTLNATEKKDDEGIIFDLEYCTSLFKKETIQKLAGHYINILKEIVKDPYKEISKIQII